MNLPNNVLIIEGSSLVGYKKAVAEVKKINPDAKIIHARTMEDVQRNATQEVFDAFDLIITSRHLGDETMDDIITSMTPSERKKVILNSNDNPIRAEEMHLDNHDFAGVTPTLKLEIGTVLQALYNGG